MTKIEAFKYFWRIIETKIDPAEEHEAFRDQQLWIQKCHEIYNNNIDIL